MAEFFSPKGKRVGVESDKNKFLISLAIPGRRISAEVVYRIVLAGEPS